MPRLPFVRLALIVASSSLAAACGGSEPTQPGGDTGTYLLASVNGAPMPYNFQTRTFLAASLKFLSRGRIEDVRYYKTTSTFGAVQYDTVTTTPSYTLSGEQFIVSHDAPAGTYADTGTLSGSTISLRTAHFDLITADSFNLVYSHASAR